MHKVKKRVPLTKEDAKNKRIIKVTPYPSETESKMNASQLPLQLSEVLVLIESRLHSHGQFTTNVLCAFTSQKNVDAYCETLRKDSEYADPDSWKLGDSGWVGTIRDPENPEKHYFRVNLKAHKVPLISDK